MCICKGSTFDSAFSWSKWSTPDLWSMRCSNAALLCQNANTNHGEILKRMKMDHNLDHLRFFMILQSGPAALRPSRRKTNAYWRCIDANARVQKLNITYVYLCYFTCLAGNHLCPWSTLLRLAPRCDVLPRFANRVLQGFAQEHTSPVDASWHLPQRERVKKGRDVQRK